MGLEDSLFLSLTHTHAARHAQTHTFTRAPKLAHTRMPHTHTHTHSKLVYTSGGFCLFAQKLICSLMHDRTFENGEKTEKSFFSVCCDESCNFKIVARLSKRRTPRIISSYLTYLNHSLPSVLYVFVTVLPPNES